MDKLGKNEVTPTWRKNEIFYLCLHLQALELTNRGKKWGIYQNPAHQDIGFQIPSCHYWLFSAILSEKTD